MPRLHLNNAFRVTLLACCASCWFTPGWSAQAFAPGQAPAPSGLEVWQTEQGLPQNSVQAVLQTRDGYLWIGTREGLARFDGVRFTVFDQRNTPELPHNQIRALFEDRAGQLWISTPGGLAQYRDGRFTAFTTRDGLSSSNVWSVDEDRSGNLWVATVNGLNRWRDGKFTSFTTGEGLAHNSIECLLEDREGTLWVGTAAGLSRFSDGRFTAFSKQRGEPEGAIRTLFQDQQGRLWIGTPNGLMAFTDGKFQAYTTRDGLAHNSILAIAQDRAGRLWVGTSGGLNLLRGGRFLAYTVKDGLPGSQVELMLAARDGGLWVGTSGGLAYFRDDKLSAFTAREGLSSNLILSLLEDREGNLWVGTEAGGLNLLKEKKFTTWTVREGLSANLVRSVYEDRTGRLWAGTQAGLDRLQNGRWSRAAIEALPGDNVQTICDDRAGSLWVGTPRGLYRLRQGTLTHYTVRDGLSDDYVRSLYEDRAGALWIGTRRGLTRLRDGKFTTWTVLDGLPNDLVGAICESRDGSLWIGTLGGLSRFRNGEFTSYTTTAGLSSDVVIALYEDADGALWIGTHGGGLNRFRDGRFAPYTMQDGLPDDVIYHILEDADGYLWMSCNRGIMRVSRLELEARRPGETRPLNCAVYGPADGLETSECSGGGHPAGWKTRDGRLWFATVKGVAMIDPAHLPFNQQPPPVAIEQVTADDEAFKTITPINWPPGRFRFEFSYTALSFIAPQKVAFRYKLEGYDRDWVEAGSRRVASYTGIPAGAYRFRVLACNNDGVWNETGAAFDFYLRPHFYETWWFYGLCLLSLALAVWWWYRARVRRLEHEFAAVLDERTRLAREIHDTLAQGFAGISVQLELVARLLERTPHRAKTHLDQARRLARDSLAEARRSVWNLRSQALEGADLPAALADIARRLVAGTPVQAHVQVSGAYRQPGRAIEDNLLRIGQEAINNALRHAQASRLDLALRFEPDKLCFSVRDDGRGFIYQPDQDGHGHFGLVGMRERAERIGGRFTISSRPQQGTEIMVEVPLGS